eukprot:GHVS01077253.1.p1 GENE.GHVS01077253.1~~GHVS01077253.1.p1  ORF type:complete len:481 (+),score=73.92 GHVS01077253.1:300-1742(+)
MGSVSTAAEPLGQQSCSKETAETTWTANRDSHPPRRPVTAIVVGAGQRGQLYAGFALDFPSSLQILGVAEPKANRRETMRKLYGIEQRFAVDDWKALAVMDKIADCAIITTQDRMHREPAVAFAHMGYHLLLEKPVAVDENDCEAIENACKANNTTVAVCHVLRYFPPCVKIREIIDSGELGEVVTINHYENILFWHFAHSFVRGNWRKEDESTFSLLSKCCHDIDLLMFWMGDRRCTDVQSFGGLYHFKKSQKPHAAGSSVRCLGCAAEASCPYSAEKLYRLDESKAPIAPTWPLTVVCDDIEIEPTLNMENSATRDIEHIREYRLALRRAVDSGPYGRCVYECDNDVCDHQMVNMLFETGATACLTMNAFTKDMRRETKVCGTRGELRWSGKHDGGIRVYNFDTKMEREVNVEKVAPKGRVQGHGGADYFLLEAFTRAVATNNPSLIPTDIRDSLRSHKIVFAAEKSRRCKTIEAVHI